MADYRFERTDADIRRAFIQALTDRGFEKLSVAELARLSQVDRTTFYAHYESLFALAARVIEDEVALLRENITQSLGNSAKQVDRYQLFSGPLVDQLIQEAEHIQKIRLISLGELGFNAQCRQLFADVYQQVLGVDPDSFTGFLLVNMAMSDLDFILSHHRAPARKELADGLAQLAAIAKRLN